MSGQTDARYWAFISYSHRDAAFGRRLHRRLESYAVPRRLANRRAAPDSVPKKLVPIFRDREELPAANDLSAEVRAALKVSRSLVVVCSPSAAASQWVSREIEAFRELHPDRPILAAVRDGEPAEVFPKALRGIAADGSTIEPLAADFRRGRDGEQLGLLKLVAGIIGVGLDELVQRDAHRRNQRVTAVTAGALAGMVVMGALTGYALNARQEAERQRAEAVRQRGAAEGLVEYMLTDLRDKLKGVGRLDVMTAVNERALRYYTDQDLANLSANSLERRARILHAMGEDDETRGDHRAALAKFQEARRTTAALLAEAPTDVERIFTHAQSEYFFGLHEYNDGHFPAARRSFIAYKALAEKLVAIEPNNARYRQEVGYADSNLCALAQEDPPDPAAAIRFCTDALVQTEQATRHLKMTSDVVNDLIDRHAWLADAYYIAGDYRRSKLERLTQERLLDTLLKADPKNMDLRDTWVVLQRALAKLERRQGDTQAAESRLKRLLAVVDEMIRFDASNNEWLKSRESVFKDLSDLQNTNRKGNSK